MAKTLVVTGASSGIGRACAEYFAEKGYDIVFSYNKNEEGAVQLNSEYPCCFPIKADFNIESQVEDFCAAALKRLGHIDVIINNAGIADYSLITHLENKKWDEILNVNLKAMFIVCKKLLPSMINAKKGSIINISSMWGICGASCEVAYSASKGGVISFTKALAKEVGASGIAVNCVAPGVIRTEMTEILGKDTINDLVDATPLMKLGEPLDIAQAAYFLSQSRFITGQVLSVDGGMTI